MSGVSDFYSCWASYETNQFNRQRTVVNGPFRVHFTA
jgi:hypothetical protein